MATLLDVHALHLAPIEELGGAECWQHDPRVASLKRRLESTLRRQLDADRAPPLDDDPADAMRRLAHDEMLPPIYDWLAEDATLDELVEFISLEGGPDADFDDLVRDLPGGAPGTAQIDARRELLGRNGPG